MFSIPASLEELARVFRQQGRQCYLVGGAIRDMLLGRRSTDYDIATDALPQEVQGMFRRVIPTGLKHGTVTVLFRGLRLEVTTFRIDREYLDGRRPDSVQFTPSIQEDLRRRDFTVNAIAYDLLSRRLLDPHGGRADLHRWSAFARTGCAPCGPAASPPSSASAWSRRPSPPSPPAWTPCARCPASASARSCCACSPPRSPRRAFG
jgi:hypothetical protein